MNSGFRKPHPNLGFVCALAMFCLFQSAVRGQQLTGAISSEAKPSLSPLLSDIKGKRLEFKGRAEQFEVKRLPPLPEGKGKTEDRTLQNSAKAVARYEVVKTFPGLGSSDNKANLAPPDSTGAAGNTQYVQWVNKTMIVYGKDGSVQYPAADGNTLWSGFGGACEESNDGDPIVLFDRLKDKNNAEGRWVLTQFAVSQGPPYFQCIAVSETSDAKGRYYRYAFKFELFNDYPKLGIWPNAYYASFNKFKDLGTKDKNGNEIFEYKQPRVCALEREKMLQGLSAQMQCFDPGSRSMLPADVDGSFYPPSDSPGLFMDYTVGALRIWQMKVDWKNSKKSTLSAPMEIRVEPFAEACVSEGCILQPKTAQKLDASGDRLMFRLSYRRFIGSDPHEVLTVNHTVRVDLPHPTKEMAWVTAIRWYELRRADGKRWELRQQGTYAPDISSGSPSSRWAGSIAMDKLGNILVGYSRASRDVFPSIFVTGRSARKDALHELEIEREVRAGKGSVIPDGENDVYRWGDYSTMTLDPDDCTFWFTSEYQEKNNSYAWQTEVTSFRFPQDCTDGPEKDVSASGKPKPTKP
jgi:hypothetical protein